MSSLKVCCYFLYLLGLFLWVVEVEVFMFWFCVLGEDKVFSKVIEWFCFFSSFMCLMLFGSFGIFLFVFVVMFVVGLNLDIKLGFSKGCWGVLSFLLEIV